jgi:pimeloyl-ACP methyl ester carboxylesterase
MLVDLLRTTTADGLRLDGALHSANPAPSRRAPAVDVLLCLHGVGSSFYGSSLFAAITPRLMDAGISMLWANTRGHDSVYTSHTPSGPRRCGAAYETVSDCRHDIAAWTDLLRQRGFERIGILGHSLGAIKAVYSEAYHPQTEVACVIAISPPRLSYSAFGNGLQSATFFESSLLANQSLEQGRPDDLIEVSFPFPLLITAAGFIDKYGPEEKYNLVKFASRVRSPILFIYGTRELRHGGDAFAGVPDALRGLPDDGQSLTVATVPEADHNYTGRHEQLNDEILGWLPTQL